MKKIIIIIISAASRMAHAQYGKENNSLGCNRFSKYFTVKTPTFGFSF